MYELQRTKLTFSIFYSHNMRDYCNYNNVDHKLNILVTYTPTRGIIIIFVSHQMSPKWSSQSPIFCIYGYY